MSTCVCPECGGKKSYAARVCVGCHFPNGNTRVCACGAAKSYSASVCKTCHLAATKAREMRVCPDCRGPKSVGAKRCWTCQYDVPRSPKGSGAQNKGYRIVTVAGKQRREHHIVMEQILQRSLLPGETVHHKNDVRDDNRPENLELWVSMQPAGQRPEDLVAWAHEILRRYES